jgi:hypothetical protein
MIDENKNPAMAGKSPPVFADGAAARITEFVVDGELDRIVGFVFANIEQLSVGLTEAGYRNVHEVLNVSGIPLEQENAATYWIEARGRDDSKWAIVASQFAQVLTIANVIKIREGKAQD